MYRSIVLTYAPILLIVIFGIFVLMKFMAIISSGLNRNYAQLFFVSLLPFSRQVIRNTFHEKLKVFYKKSNTLNNIFYFIMFMVLAAYILMKLVS